MADLRVGSTTGGSVIWHQGNFPLTPVSNDLFYKTYKVYTEFNKPQAADNDFVSKANGGTYLGRVIFNKGIQVPAAGNGLTGVFVGPGDGATYDKVNLDIVSWYGIGFKSSQGTGPRTIVFNVRDGEISARGNINSQRQVRAEATAPIAANDLTRKDYVDGLINTVTANADSRVLRKGDTMTGLLTAPNFVSQNKGSADNHVARIDQVVLRGTSEDFGYY